MLKQLGILYAYSKAPRTTFVTRHPRAALTAIAVRKGLEESRTLRRVTAGLVGLGAASVAIPAAALFLISGRRR
ncbi:MAG TPA: hypothetical protein VMT16_06050 [Thermoanaerobaculia bacterium]|nr:hypothetical protein [Thermoanaerobaculia bacterium]